MQLPMSAAVMVAEPVVGLHLGGQLGDRPRAVRRVRADDVRLQRGEIDLDDPVVVLLRRRPRPRGRLSRCGRNSSASAASSARPVARR